ncbi:hypothetical protein BAE44_0009462, partial [Dichanthelium oligosanthes]
LVAVQPWPICRNTAGNYMANSTYQSNLARLATSLPRLHAGALPGDTANASACGSCWSCVATAFQDAQQLCAFHKDAAVYYDACYLRFSNTDILAA